jgi:hypothetical protein
LIPTNSALSPNSPAEPSTLPLPPRPTASVSLRPRFCCRGCARRGSSSSRLSFPSVVVSIQTNTIQDDLQQGSAGRVPCRRRPPCVPFPIPYCLYINNYHALLILQHRSPTPKSPLSTRPAPRARRAPSESTAASCEPRAGRPRSPSSLRSCFWGSCSSGRRSRFGWGFDYLSGFGWEFRLPTQYDLGIAVSPRPLNRRPTSRVWT